MNTKRIAAVMAMSALLLVGCGAADVDTGKGTNLSEKKIALKDGRQVTCVAHVTGYAGGLSCDWDNAK